MTGSCLDAWLDTWMDEGMEWMDGYMGMHGWNGWIQRLGQADFIWFAM